MSRLYVISIVFLFAFITCIFAQEKSWMIGPFVREKDPKPILTPQDNTSFQDPISGKTVVSRL